MTSAKSLRLPPRLVSVVKLVVHKPRDDAGFANGLVAQENLRLHIKVQPTVGSGLADPESEIKRRTSLYFASGDTVAPLAMAPAALPQSLSLSVLVKRPGASHMQRTSQATKVMRYREGGLQEEG